MLLLLWKRGGVIAVLCAPLNSSRFQGAPIKLKTLTCYERGALCLGVHTQCNWLKENATDGKCANCWGKRAVDKMGEINIPSAPGMGFNFPLWAFLLQLGKLIISIPIPGGKVEGLACMAVCVRVCVKFDAYSMWLGGETGRERERERETEERTHESITNHTEPRTMIHAGDTVVTQLNDSAVTG